MPAAGVATIALIVLIVLALVYYLLNTILQLRAINHGLDEVIQSVGEIVEKSAPLLTSCTTSTTTSTPRSARLRPSWSRRPGWRMRSASSTGSTPAPRPRACAPSRRAATSRRRGSARSTPRGTLTLARLGREAPVATASPAGPALRDPAYGSAAARGLYAGDRPARSPVIGADAPVQYEEREDIGQPRKRFRRS